jgi:acetyltransferase-like isoleucine patch superfamily enzyme
MLNKFIKLFNLPLIDKYNKIVNLYYRIKTHFFYVFIFESIGKKTLIKKPLFLSNTHNIKIGQNVFIRDNARLEVVNDKGYINIEDNVSIEQNIHITSGGKLVIGKNTTISALTFITNIDHEYRELGVHILKQPYIIKDTFIGENCFIGYNVAIQAGTILGKQCIVGAHAVVRGKYPDYCVIVGAPARIIKRYDEKMKKWRKTNDKGEFIDEV